MNIFKSIIYISIIASIGIFSSCSTNSPEGEETKAESSQVEEPAEAASKKHVHTESCTTGTHTCGEHCGCGDGCKCTAGNTCSSACKIKGA